MKLLTIFELAAKPESELRALYREAMPPHALTGQARNTRMPWPRWRISAA